MCQKNKQAPKRDLSSLIVEYSTKHYIASLQNKQREKKKYSHPFQNDLNFTFYTKFPFPPYSPRYANDNNKMKT